MNTIESIAWSAELRNLGRRFGERIAVNTGAATLSYRMLDRMAHGLAEHSLEAYGTHGDNDAVIRAGKQFLAQFSAAGSSTEVASAMADAYSCRAVVSDEVTSARFR